MKKFLKSLVLVALVASPLSAFAQAPVLVSVVSAKAHATAGVFNLPVDFTQAIGGAVTVEPRAIGTGHTLIFTFNAPVTSIGAVSVADLFGAPLGAASTTVSGSSVVVTLTGSLNTKRAKVSISNVNGTGVGASASVGFLLGDVDGSRTVDSSDVSSINAALTQTVSSSNFKNDVNTSGTLSLSDVLVANANLGQALQSAAPSLTSVVSRNVHGTAGTFSLPIDLTQSVTGAVTVEPRALGSHTLVFTFSAPVTSLASVTAVDQFGAPVGSVSSAAMGNMVVVALNNVPNAKRVKVTLTNVNNTGGTAAASVGFLYGDITGNRFVDSTDTAAMNAQLAQTVSTANFKNDVNTSGTLTLSDLIAVSQQSGTSI